MDAFQTHVDAVTRDYVLQPNLGACMRRTVVGRTGGAGADVMRDDAVSLAIGQRRDL